MTFEIRGPVELPALREDIELITADGLTLVGELATPLDGDPVATLVTLHPLPTAGGFMDSHIIRKAAARLPAQAGLAVLRFNTRGTASPRGTSEGTFDGGAAEQFDVAAAMDFVRARGLPHPWLVGWSFGTDLTLVHGLDPLVSGAVLISPPLRWSTEENLRAWADSGTSEAEIAYQPGRVLMHDTTSTPALVDLAAMRSTLAEAGVDPRGSARRPPRCEAAAPRHGSRCFP